MTLPIPIQLSVSVAKFTRANVIATPRVSVSARWQSCISTSSGSERQLSTTSTARTAAAAAASAVPEAVDHAEQRGAAADVDRDRMVAAHVLARSRAAHRRPFDRPEPAML